MGALTFVVPIALLILSASQPWAYQVENIQGAWACCALADTKWESYSMYGLLFGKATAILPTANDAFIDCCSLEGGREGR